MASASAGLKYLKNFPNKRVLPRHRSKGIDFFASLGLLLELTLELSASRAKSERTPYSRVQLAVRSDGYKSTMVSEC